MPHRINSLHRNNLSSLFHPHRRKNPADGESSNLAAVHPDRAFMPLPAAEPLAALTVRARLVLLHPAARGRL